MLKVLLKVENPNIVKETLSRMGVYDRQKKIMRPSVFLHEVDGEFFLIHFKEWFLISYPNSYNNISDDDKNRVAYVTHLLHSWGLIEYVDYLKPKEDKK